MEQNPAIKESSLYVADIHIDSIDPDPNNTNEMDEETFARLCDEIRENGMIVPLILVAKPDKRFRLLGGDKKWKAASAVGYKFVPSVILSDEKWNDPDIFDLVSVRLNEIRGVTSAVKLAPLYERVVAKHGAEAAQKIIGITHNDVFRKLVRKMAKNIQKNLPPDMAKKVEEAAAKAKDPSQLGKSLSKIFAQEAKGMESNCFVFQANGKQHVLVKCKPDLFAAVTELVRYVQAYGDDINDVLFTSILNPLRTYQARNQTEPIAEETVAEVNH